MDYMMNDFRIIYLCSRNHNEVVAGVFIFSPQITQINTEFKGVLLSFFALCHPSFRIVIQSEAKDLGDIKQWNIRE